MTLAADLHIHTALSPCAAEEMTPPAIVQAARQSGLAMIAICDHNAAGNVAAVQTAAGDSLAVVAGMEVTTAEEVHVLGLFPNATRAVAAADEVRQTLPVADDAYYTRFGPQYIMNAVGEVVGREPRMLAVASALPLATAVALIHRYSGMAIAAHIDRPSFSVLSQLGVFPMDAGLDGVEMFTAAQEPGGRSKSREVEKSDSGPCWRFAVSPFRHFAVLRSSDSHFLADVGSVRSTLQMRAPTFEELVLTLRGVDGRAVGHA